MPVGTRCTRSTASPSIPQDREEIAGESAPASDSDAVELGRIEGHHALDVVMGSAFEGRGQAVAVAR